MKGIAEIGFSQLLAAYVFLILLLVMASRQGIDKEKEIIVSALRMTFQLVLMGYVLVYILEFNSLLLSACTLFLMELFAVKNIYSRVKVEINPRLRRVIVFSMFTGTVTPLLYFLLAVINISPWYEARYFIPIAGMFIGNSMTGVSLGTERLIDSIKTKRELIEGALMLGATPKQAAKIAVNDAFTAAIMPTINSMVGMGIVFLPGMMTGQILSGISPLTAIKYQIAIMLGVLGSVSLTVFMLVRLGYKTFFNERAQLVG
ncbi:MAG TPA: iron export ABC transporter permease subunit FetB [Peptococcaceae bacterium]|nr:MAG: YbbM seven transmembrane helix protein [Clostridia bacterium 41_269]HBT20573.1 iron export ABC transporter permease subunit FetB [Peptococcaceae bacterium]